MNEQFTLEALAATASQREAVEQELHSLDRLVRRMIVDLHASGASADELARSTGESTATVYAMLTRPERVVRRAGRDSDPELSAMWTVLLSPDHEYARHATEEGAREEVQQLKHLAASRGPACLSMRGLPKLGTGYPQVLPPQRFAHDQSRFTRL